MEGQLETVEAPAARRFPRAFRRHAMAVVVIAAVLVGGALRLVPAIASDTPAPSDETPASTACAAT